MGERKIKISYIKKPFARNSFICLPVAVVSLILGIISLYISIGMEGNGDLNVAAWGLSSFLFAITAVAYGGISFLEKEKKYLLSKIGIGISGLLVIFWFCLLLAGFRA